MNLRLDEVAVIKFTALALRDGDVIIAVSG
jgi:hypothetical protein